MTLPLFGAPQEEATSDDYYTPSWVFEQMGIRFDLDVAAPPGGVPWIPADRFYTKADNGLAQEWSGRVWMNPPYSDSAPWASKFLDHGDGVALLPMSKSEWMWEVWKWADGLVVPRQGGTWFSFVGGKPETKGQIFMPVFFVAMGSECVDAISHLGHVR